MVAPPSQRRTHANSSSSMSFSASGPPSPLDSRYPPKLPSGMSGRTRSPAEHNSPSPSKRIRPHPPRPTEYIRPRTQTRLVFPEDQDIMEEEPHFTPGTAPEPVPHEASTNTLPQGVPPPIIPPTALHPLPIPDVSPPHAIAAIPPHVVPAGPPSQAVVMVLSGPSDVGLADAEQERQNRFEELASTLDRMVIDIQEAEERCERNYHANEEERERIFVENERRRDIEAEEWRKESMREAASRHAEDIREVIRLERESAQTERERAQELDQEERDRIHEEYQADIRALEDELDVVRKELEDEKMARWMKKAERHERGRAAMLEQNSRMHRNHFDNPIGLLFRRAWRKFRRDKWLDFHHLEKS